MATILLLICPLAAVAHGVWVEAKLKGDRVVVEAFYDDDMPADDAKVVITDDNGKEVIQGRTDKKGVWSFAAPAAGKYKVSVDAGGGHRAKTTFSIPSKSDALPNSEESSVSGVTVSEGPTREAFTGTMRWAMAVAGLGLIAVIFLLVHRYTQKNSSQPGLETVNR